jgi:hypothetical protein
VRKLCIAADIYCQMKDPSRLRQRLRLLAREVPDLVEPALGKSPLWRGLVLAARRKCGRENCHCARGTLHVSTVLADRSGVRQRNLALKGPDLRLFRRLTEDYRQVRKIRARLVQIGREMLALLDELEEQRRREGVRRYGGRLPGPRRVAPRKRR